MNDIFTGINIVEFSNALAGPLVGTFFKELGADVVKIEPPHGDVSRKWKLPSESKVTPESYYYCCANGNKPTQSFDLNKARSDQRIVKWIHEADLIITNFTSERAEKYGLDYQALRRINSEIILGNITGFGLQDNRPAYDVLLQAESGLMSMMGHQGNDPIRVPIPIVDILAAHQLKEGLLCALFRKQKTGEGSEVQVSLYDSILSALANPATNYLMGNVKPKRMGSKHPSIAPYGDTYLTLDNKWVILAIGSNFQFQNLCKALRVNNLITDKRFITNDDRVTNRNDLNKVLQEVFLRKDALHWSNVFYQEKLSGTIIKDLDFVLDQPAARSMIIKEKINDQLTSMRMKQQAFSWQSERPFESTGIDQ